MGRIIFLFLIAFPSFSWAAKKPPENIGICAISKSCAKSCELKIAGKFNEADEDHQELILKCAQDITNQVNQRRD